MRPHTSTHTIRRCNGRQNCPSLRTSFKFAFTAVFVSWMRGTMIPQISYFKYCTYICSHKPIKPKSFSNFLFIMTAVHAVHYNKTIMIHCDTDYNHFCTTRNGGLAGPHCPSMHSPYCVVASLYFMSQRV